MSTAKSNVADSARSLHSFVQRVERLLDEKASLGEDLKEVFSEAKDAGYNNKILRIVLKRRAMEKADLEEQDQLVDTYEHMLSTVLD